MLRIAAVQNMTRVSSESCQFSSVQSSAGQCSSGVYGVTLDCELPYIDASSTLSS